MGVCKYGISNVWLRVCTRFLMCGYMYGVSNGCVCMYGFSSLCVCMYGVCNVRLCVCVGFVM